MTDKPKWLGVDAVDGASAGPLFLNVSIDGHAWVTDHGGIALFVDNCPLSEVDARTREWLRSLAALLGPADEAERAHLEAGCRYAAQELEGKRLTTGQAAWLAAERKRRGATT